MPVDKKKQKELAKKGCDKYFEDCMKRIFKDHMDCLSEVAAGRKTKEECKAEYIEEMKLCKKAHEKNLDLVKIKFPE